ncbi:MAG: PTS transporter subunit IIC [Spirochaetota bacterium]
MEQIESVVTYILSFKPYVMLPLIIFLIATFLRIHPVISVKACLSIGIGFIGIFLVFDYFVAAIGPATETIVEQTGVQFDALDVGWPPLASIAWSFTLAPVMILAVIGVNSIMLVLRLTRVINIDIWNFWHFIMVGSLVYSSTGSYLLAIGAIIAAEILMLKIGDFAGPYASRYAGIPGITITTLSAGGYFPFGLLGNSLIERIPFLNRLNADPERIRRKLGLLGEPMIIGFILGGGLGIAAGYDLRMILELAFTVAAVVLILPLMCGILSDGLIPISEGMKEYVKKRFPHASQTYIGLDNAILQGDTAVIVTGLLLMPIAMILAFVLPGITFIPIGDLANIIALGVMIVVATRGNVIRSIIISIPLIVAHLYIAGFMASSLTRLSSDAGFKFPGYEGKITSFFDGGLVWRLWLF